MEKSSNGRRYPSSQASGERIAKLWTKPTVVPEFIQIRVRGS